MNIENAIERAIEQTNKVAGRSIARVTAQATRYSTQSELEQAYTNVIEVHSRTLAALHSALSMVRGVA